MTSLGLIIGRFQPLHKGHLLLINKSLEQKDKTLIFIGSSNKNDEYNPYAYNFRKEILEHEVSNKNLQIEQLPDFPSDTEWKNEILKYISEEVQELTLYCGDAKNDSAVKSLLELKNTLPFELQIIEIPRSIIPVSATQVRKWIGEKNMNQLQKYLGTKTLEKII